MPGSANPPRGGSLILRYVPRPLRSLFFVTDHPPFCAARGRPGRCGQGSQHWPYRSPAVWPQASCFSSLGLSFTGKQGGQNWTTALRTHILMPCDQRPGGGLADPDGKLGPSSASRVNAFAERRPLAMEAALSKRVPAHLDYTSLHWTSKGAQGLLCRQLPAERQHGRSGLKGSPRWAAGQAFMDPWWEKEKRGGLEPHVVEPLWFSRGYRLPQSANLRSRESPDGQKDRQPLIGWNIIWGAAGLMLGGREQSKFVRVTVYGQNMLTVLCV